MGRREITFDRVVKEDLLEGAISSEGWGEIGKEPKITSAISTLPPNIELLYLQSLKKSPYCIINLWCWELEW